MPVQVSSLNSIISIGGGMNHSLFLKSDTTVWACGQNTDGQLGDGTVLNKPTPVQVKGLCGLAAVEDIFAENNLCIYPNPTNGKFHISSALSRRFQDLGFEVYNSLGEKIYSEKIYSEKTEIDLNGQPNGIYFFQLKHNNDILGKGKIIVN